MHKISSFESNFPSTTIHKTEKLNSNQKLLTLKQFPFSLENLINITTFQKIETKTEEKSQSAIIYICQRKFTTISLQQTFIKSENQKKTFIVLDCWQLQNERKKSWMNQIGKHIIFSWKYGKFIFVLDINEVLCEEM